MATPFFWQGNTGEILTPEQVKRQRLVAESLAAKAAPTTFGAGLSRVGDALQYNAIGARTAEAEKLGLDSASQAFSGLSDGSGSNAEIIAALSNPWVAENPAQSGIAQALLQQNMKRDDPMNALDLQLKQAQIDKMNAEAAGGGEAATFFGTPIWGTGPDGQPAFGQLNNQGQFQVTDTGDFQAGKEPIKLDGGTDWILLDPVTRQPVGKIPKNNEEAAFQTATGTGLGKDNAENIVAAETLSSKLPGIKAVVDELGQLAEVATYTQTGQLIDAGMREAGMEPSEAAVARTKYIAIVDNQVLPLLRDTFGAAFTVKEGETLRATLGDANKSPIEKQAILEAFIEQKVRDLAAMESRIPGDGAPANSDVDSILQQYGL